MWHAQANGVARNRIRSEGRGVKTVTFQRFRLLDFRGRGRPGVKRAEIPQDSSIFGIDLHGGNERRE